MPHPPNDPVLNMFAGGMMLLSLMACMNLFFMRRRGPVLPYEPRRPVPWGAVGCILALMLVLFVGIAAIGGEGDVSVSPKPPTPSELITATLGHLFIVGAFLFVVAVLSKATPRDLGLPATNSELVRDVFVGAAACLAALAPVHVTQLTMLHLFFPDQLESGQPIIKMVMARPDPIMLWLAGMATVVVAPICEEVTFRLLLQGWLETLGRRSPRLAQASDRYSAVERRDANHDRRANSVRSFVIRCTRFIAPSRTASSRCRRPAVRLVPDSYQRG